MATDITALTVMTGIGKENGQKSPDMLLTAKHNHDNWHEYITIITIRPRLYLSVLVNEVLAFIN